MCNTGIACMFRMPKQISRPVALFVAMPANLGRIKDRDWAILMYISRTYCAEIRLWQRATEPLATLDYMDIRYIVTVQLVKPYSNATMRLLVYVFTVLITVHVVVYT